MSPRMLHDAIARALDAARREGRDQWVVHRVRAEGDGSPATPDANDAFVYAVPEEGFRLETSGAAAVVEAAGPDRFRAVQRGIDDVASRCHAVDTDAGPPVWVGGFAFADDAPTDATWRGFAPARWWLPARTTGVQDGVRFHTIARRVSSQDDPLVIAHELESALDALRAPAAGPPGLPTPSSRAELDAHGDAAAHRTRVAEALAAIGRGDLEKVVVARALDVTRRAGFDVPSLLEHLRRDHPTCAVFGVRRDDAWLVGATPERLLRRRGRRLVATALAGSAARGRTPEEDAALRRALVESKKEQSEHSVVVRELRAGLEASGLAPHVPESPEVLALGGVQHLCTRVDAELAGDGPDLLAIAGHVHPTAAVAGAPRDAATRWIVEGERPERGWYAGLVGWRTADGDGELSATLRCALLRGERARLFAGGGIVAGSDPEAELRETRLKWNALLPALLEL